MALSHDVQIARAPFSHVQHQRKIDAKDASHNKCSRFDGCAAAALPRQAGCRDTRGTSAIKGN